MRRAWVPVATGVLLALTACGGGSGGTAGSGASPGTLAGQAPVSEAAAPSAGASVSGSSGDVDVCRLLPASDVSRITGAHYTRTKSSSTMGQIFECEYTDASFGLLQVSVAVTNGGIDYDADVQALTGAGFPPTSVSGDGDKAFAMPDPQGNAGSEGAASFASYGVLFGDQYVSIGGSYVSADQGRQIADEIHTGL